LPSSCASSGVLSVKNSKQPIVQVNLEDSPDTKSIVSPPAFIGSSRHTKNIDKDNQNTICYSPDKWNKIEFSTIEDLRQEIAKLH
jgi:hypothetical protein